MAGSGNLVLCRLLPLLLLFTPFLLPFSSASQEITYKCLKRGEHPFILVYAEFDGETVSDVFGKGAENSCGVKAQNFTGQGNKRRPYRLLLNVSGIADVTDGVCGINKKGDLVELTIVTRTSTGTYADTQDKEAKIKCDFSKDIVVNSQNQINLVEQTAHEIGVNVTLEFDGSPTEMTVGTDTFLEMKIVNINVLSVIVPFRCWAMRNANDPKKVLILDDYCPVSGSPVEFKFAAYQTTSTQRSNTFKAFRFFDSDVLFIRCIVDLCAKVQDCVTVNCGTRGKRSIHGGQQHNHVASTNTSVIVKSKGSSKEFFTKNQLPFIGTLFPISVFLVVILFATVIFLVMKLKRTQVYKDRLKNLGSSEG